MNEKGFLVVGGDSLVGGGLYKALERRGHKVKATTRRRDSLNDNRIYLDFENESPFCPPSDIGYAFVVAAATNYERCKNDPLARRINVELIPRTVASLLEQGLFVTFISTNSVFGGERAWPKEDDSHMPGIAYARQKSEGEASIRDAARRQDASGRLNIVRLTKILNSNVPPLKTWFQSWKKRKVVEPFSDLIFSPLSVQFAGEALAKIGEKNVAGALHISGAENVTYVDLARAVVRKLGLDEHLIAPTTAVEKGVDIAFKPRFSGLNMDKTQQLCGIAPQTLESVVDDLLEDLSYRNRVKIGDRPSLP